MHRQSQSSALFVAGQSQAPIPLPPALKVVPVPQIDRWNNEGGAERELGAGVLRILLVEDDAVVSELLGEMLVGMGHDICAVAATEDAAIRAAALTRPDLLIVDANLGRGSGIDAVNTITRARPVSHLFTSGDAAVVRRRMPDSVVVQKPFDEAALTQAIELAVAAS